MKPNKAYRVSHEYSGDGLEQSCLVWVEDQHGTIWQDRVLDRDQYESNKDFRKAIRDIVDAYRAEWLK
jgi:hypothetical protein